MRSHTSTTLFNKCQIVDIFEAMHANGNFKVARIVNQGKEYNGPQLSSLSNSGMHTIHSENLPKYLNTLFMIRNEVAYPRNKRWINSHLLEFWNSDHVFNMIKLFGEVHKHHRRNWSWRVCMLMKCGRISIRQCEVDAPLMFPNCLGLRQYFIASIFPCAIKCSVIFEKLSMEQLGTSCQWWQRTKRDMCPIPLCLLTVCCKNGVLILSIKGLASS